MTQNIGSKIRLLTVDTSIGFRNVIASFDSLKSDKDGMVQLMMPLLVEGSPDTKYEISPLHPAGAKAVHVGLAKRMIVSVSEPDPQLASMFMDVLASAINGMSLGTTGEA